MNAMNDRKKEILEETISSYIEKAEPVGSKALVQRGKFPFSSATIRNELNELERDGYLTQVHTSSGRIPTDKGYRLYVDNLMNLNKLPLDHQRHLEEHIKTVSQNISDGLIQITQIMASVIDYTVIVMMPDVFQETLKAIYMILVDLDKVLVVLLSYVGVNKEFVLQVKEGINQDDLNKISNLINRKLEGKSLLSIDSEEFSSLMSELPNFKKIIKDLYREVSKLTIKSRKSRSLMTRGMSNMIKLPEFKNIEYTQKVLEILEEDKVLCQLLLKYLSPEQTGIIIGEENEIQNLKECSIVMTPYRMEKETFGALGVLGPKRMAYPLVVPMLQHISKLIEKYINNKENEGV